MQVLSDNIAAAFRAEMEAMYEKLIGDLSEMFTVTVDLSSVSQSTATQLLQSLGFQITVLPLAAAIQVTRSWCKVHSLGWFFVVQRLAHGCWLQEEGLGDALAALPELDAREAEFMMEEHANEQAATLPFQQHLQASSM